MTCCQRVGKHLVASGDRATPEVQGRGVQPDGLKDQPSVLLKSTPHFLFQAPLMTSLVTSWGMQVSAPCPEFSDLGFFPFFFFLKLRYNSHKTYSFKVCNAAAFSILTKSCKDHQGPIPEHFHHLTQNLRTPISSHSPSPHSTPSHR